VSHKQRQSFCIDFRPSLHENIIADLSAALTANKGEKAVDYLADVLLSKYVGPDTDPADVRAQRAIEKWLKTEHGNVKTNIRMYSAAADFGYADADEVLDLAARFIRKVIGDSPPKSFNGSFTGGASTRVKRGTGSVARKFMGQAHVTLEAWPYVLPMILENTGWFLNHPEVLRPQFVEGNVMFTVPKRTDIDRVACKEPDLNMYAQKAVGDFIRRRLHRAGINLNDQSVNRDLARRGSIDGSLATIDLSSASDSVTTGLVGRLLPPGWFLLLDAIRSKRTLIGESVHENAMFSSMGNGFTFELESLIFWTLARAIAFYSGTRGRISVYGDDIIVPRKMAARLARTFSYFGFTVNTEKSEWKGYFRESCGGHYYRGADVTPFYVKEPIVTVERLIHFLNRLRKWAGQCFGDICDPRFFEVWSKYATYVDKRLWGGDNVADPRQLVSRHTSRFKLSLKRFRLERLEEELQSGLYLQALNAMHRRFSSPLSEEEPLRFSSPDEIVRWLDRVEFGKPSTLEGESTRWILRRARKRTSVRDFPLWYDATREVLL